MSGHNTETDLESQLLKAGQVVYVGERYVHYKNPQKTYIVRAIGLDEQSETVSIVYQAEYGKKLTWIRPLDNFLEAVHDQDGKKVPRFKKRITQ
ncbi:MAG: DUF1653 domain-containing protein [Candidatus Dojkabacteria bacterium]